MTKGSSLLTHHDLHSHKLLSVCCRDKSKCRVTEGSRSVIIVMHGCGNLSWPTSTAGEYVLCDTAGLQMITALHSCQYELQLKCVADLDCDCHCCIPLQCQRHLHIGTGCLLVMKDAFPLKDLQHMGEP